LENPLLFGWGSGKKYKEDKIEKKKEEDRVTCKMVTHWMLCGWKTCGSCWKRRDVKRLLVIKAWLCVMLPLL
jgi:hypothetical protein